MKRVLLWTVVALLAYRVVGCVADQMMGCGSAARAETTVTKAWYLEEPRDVLMFTWGEEYRLELGFESTKRRDRGGDKEGEHQKLGFSLALNRVFTWHTGPLDCEWSPIFGLGIGLGLRYDFQWKTERYKVVVAEVDYPAFKTSSNFFVQVVGTFSWGPGVLMIHLRVGESESFDSIFGVGVGW